jgi:hypothetical protein
MPGYPWGVTPQVMLKKPKSDASSIVQVFLLFGRLANDTGFPTFFDIKNLFKNYA